MDTTKLNEATGADQSSAQVIVRAATILKIMARRGQEGMRLSHLSKMSELPHPTVHRMLKTLIDVGLVVQNKDTKRYLLGPLNFELGLATQYRSDFKSKYRPLIERIADITGELVYIGTRSGSELCLLDRVGGDESIRRQTLEAGGRRPITFSAGGRALLARLDLPEVSQLIDDNGRDISQHGRLTKAGIQQAVESARVHGYATIRETTALNISAFGMAIPNGNRRPIFSISITTNNDRLTPARARELHATLRAELRNPELALAH